MTSLDSIVLPLTESCALVEQGIVLETAMVWIQDNDDQRVSVVERSRTEEILDLKGEVTVLFPAPVLSELLDAIRAKAVLLGVKAGRTMAVERHECGDIEWEIVERGEGACEDDWQVASGKGDTDLLAAAALLMEVSK